MEGKKKERCASKLNPTDIVRMISRPFFYFLILISLSVCVSLVLPHLLAPSPQSVPLPPLAPARPPAPVPSLATQTKTLCLAQFN